MVSIRSVTSLLVLSIDLSTAIPTFLQNVLQNGISKELNTRELEIGELNFLHTTDTHGWLGSHINQANYDADWGDFVSFASSFKRQKVGKSRDLILIDTGDKHDGNGLSDATVPNGRISTEIFNEQDYDLLTLGNHELYTAENTILEYYSTALSQKFKDAYVSSNVEFVTDDGDLVPFGSKYRYFETHNQNIRILALSFMFNFQRTNPRARVSPATSIFQQDWFKQMVKQYPQDKVDVIVIFGHMPITDPEAHEINHVHTTLRKLYPETVIQYFGGHSHIRDFAVFDERATGLQSGRFSETVGFLSIDKIKSGAPEFKRRYIDFGKHSFAYHSGVSRQTKKGQDLSLKIASVRQELNLNEVIGHVPTSYYMYSKPITSKHNIYNLLVTKVLPRLKSDQTDETKSRFIIINTGSIRYDLYKGNFTKDTEFIVSPFPNDWNFVEVPLSLAEGVADYLNEGPVLYTSMAPPGARSRKRHPESCPFIHDPKLSKGYTTRDDFGCDGDDVPHNTELYFTVPNVVQSVELKPTDGVNVHLVFYSFIQKDILKALNELGETRLSGFEHFTDRDCKRYGGASTKELLKEYIRDGE
ncbi:LANO_0B00650g1_1 [Lachancea nothofagi CBS 11611]|uniref:LANO_0B00650g1_1 n=1 Tax=Lachancea nothofagi CBS 11611 TaxID=1266666 RepID=A0A1G4IUK9_9SACH|nr:LANO_0B00650g1_1 [Lachancea nothofagi CBS 11611]